MNRFDETAYNLLLSDLIRDRKKSSPYFTDDSTERRDADVMALTEKIARKHPEILERLLAFTVDAKSRNISQKDILEFLGSKEKGASVLWHDRDGNEVLFVNTGKSSHAGKKRIVILSGAFSEGDIESLKKRLLKEILKTDVGKAYKRIATKENQQVMKEKTASGQKSIRPTTKKNTVAFGFERDFKRRIKAQGFGASSAKTFKSMVNAMSGSQAKSLLKSLSAMGVKPGEDFKNLLSRWRAEALNEKLLEDKRPKRKVSLSWSQDMEMGMGM
ncbi:MAG: hypothetical protein IJ530_04380 [Treponema sp.]|uniref:hypothetical protein n=1 Tax=Treponema sp. TaxID=166 RepID=UPI0025E4E799|nr:hypothetical protein [Treponema sp.]MBQ8678982.1 hypothetical protein [Treponema sp.]